MIINSVKENVMFFTSYLVKFIFFNIFFFSIGTMHVGSFLLMDYIESTSYVISSEWNFI